MRVLNTACFVLFCFVLFCFDKGGVRAENDSITFCKRVTGRFISSGAMAGALPNCTCMYPGAKYSNCSWECWFESDFTTFLQFTDISDDSDLWVQLVGKKAEIISLVSFIEKGELYDMCTHLPPNEKRIKVIGNLEIYRLSPEFPITNTLEGADGE